MNSSHSVAHAALSLLSGVLFALGLALSQMVNPAKVLNFLDVAGDWDPTLAFVMGGAQLITIPAFRLVLRRAHPLLETKFYLPTKLDIDVKLIAGAALFGSGWGIAGLCPGPAITAITTGMLPVVGFLLAMTAGVYLQKLMFPNNA